MNNQGLPPVGGNSNGVRADEHPNGHESVQPQIIYIREEPSKKRRSSGFKWVLFAIVSALIVALVVCFAVWMMGIQTLMTSVQHGVAQNSAQLQDNHNLLVRMQQQLATMNTHLAQLGNTLRADMLQLIRLLHGG